MAVSLQELLLPQVVMDVISRVREGRGPLGAWLGFQPKSFDPATASVSGANTLRGSGSVRNYTYRIFDHTRVPLKGRAPATGPATVAANPMGENTVRIARFHQKVVLNYEMLGNLSPMIGPNSQIDPGGQDYIVRQTRFLAEQCNNAVETMAAGMMRDSLYLIFSGDDQFLSFTAPTGTQVGFQINFNIPSTNKGQLANGMGTGQNNGNPIIDVSWSNVDAAIIRHLQQIIAAYAQLSRYTMTDVWINSTLWYNIITNTSVRNTAGSSNTPFAEFTKKADTGMSDPGPGGMYSAVLRGNETVEWHFCDDTIAFSTDIDPSYATQPTGSVPSGATLNKLVPDNTAIFCTKPSPDWMRMYLGGEYVCENEGQPAALRMGWHFWHQYVTQPSACELICLLNAVPVLYVPTVVAPATVVF